MCRSRVDRWNIFGIAMIISEQIYLVLRNLAKIHELIRVLTMFSDNLQTYFLIHDDPTDGTCFRIVVSSRSHKPWQPWWALIKIAPAKPKKGNKAPILRDGSRFWYIFMASQLQTSPHSTTTKTKQQRKKKTANFPSQKYDEQKPYTGSCGTRSRFCFYLCFHERRWEGNRLPKPWQPCRLSVFLFHPYHPCFYSRVSFVFPPGRLFLPAIVQ